MVLLLKYEKKKIIKVVLHSSEHVEKDTCKTDRKSNQFVSLALPALVVVFIDEWSLIEGPEVASQPLSMLTAEANMTYFFRLTEKAKDDLLPACCLLLIVVA